MNKSKFLKRACLAAAVSMIPVSQAALAEASISGWINQGVTYADDGNSSDIVSTADNGTTLGSRITFAGSTELPAGLNAGFEVILEPRTDSDGVLGFGSLGGSSAIGTPDAFSNATGDVIATLGHSLFFAGNWGKVTFGLQSMPTDNIAVLEDPSLTLWASISPVFRGNNLGLQNSGVQTGFAPGSFLQCLAVPGLNIGIDCNGIYRQGVRYDLPTFIENLGIAVGWANDDVYDVSAKYKGQLGRLNGQIALGYAQNSGTAAGSSSAGIVGGGIGFNSADNFQLQAGLMDPVTGLFGSIAYQHEEADYNAAATAAAIAGSGAVSDDTDAYWLKVGIKKAFNSLGDTSLAFQYGSYNDQYALATATAGVTGSEVERIGFEMNQYFGSSLIIYGVWENLDVEAEGLVGTVTPINSADDIDTFTLGLTYFF